MLSTPVAREKPRFQALSERLIVLLCAEVVRQGVPQCFKDDSVSQWNSMEKCEIRPLTVPKTTEPMVTKFGMGEDVAERNRCKILLQSAKMFSLPQIGRAHV